MKVTIDLNACVGAGSCATVAPKTFDQRIEDGLAILLNENPAPEDQEAVRQAAAMCPACAIKVEE